MSTIKRWPCDIPKRQVAPLELESWELPTACRQAADEKMQHRQYMAKQQHGTECCADTSDVALPSWLDRIADKLTARTGLALLALSATMVMGLAALVVQVLP